MFCFLCVCSTLGGFPALFFVAVALPAAHLPLLGSGWGAVCVCWPARIPALGFMCERFSTSTQTRDFTQKNVTDPSNPAKTWKHKVWPCFLVHPLPCSSNNGFLPSRPSRAVWLSLTAPSLCLHSLHALF